MIVIDFPDYPWPGAKFYVGEKITGVDKQVIIYYIKSRQSRYRTGGLNHELAITGSKK